MRRDIQYAIRMLLKRPGFTLVAVITLALGIGANSAIFSVVNGVVLKPLPSSEPDQLVMIWEHNLKRNRDRNVISPANFLDWQQQNRSFEGMSAFRTTRMTLTGEGEPVRIQAEIATADYFSLLRASAAQGRIFTKEEDLPGKPPVVVVSHRFWQRYGGGDPNMIGDTITLNGNPVTVIGVMPQGFSFWNKNADLWMPLRLDPANDYRESAGRYLLSFGRLKPGVTLAQAQAEMLTIAGQLEQGYPESNTGWSVNLVSMHEQVVGDIASPLYILLGVVGFVLLIACANVANLMLARALSRQREIAIRASLGAGRRHIMSQLLTESLLLALLGGAFGALLAMWGIDLLKSIGPSNIPRLDNVQIDLGVLGFTMGIALLTGLLFGLAPGWAAVKHNLTDAMKEGGRGTGTSGVGGRLRNMLVVVEVALSLVLLVGAGLMLRSFDTLMAVNPGFTAEQVMTFKIALPGSQYPEGEQRVAFFKQLIGRIETLPGVEAAGAGISPPFTGLAPATSFWRADQPKPAAGERAVTDVRWVQPGYFKTLNIPLMRGRLLTEQDMAQNRGQIVVSETMARDLFPDEDPIGKQIAISWGDPVISEIVGVVGDVKHMSLDADIRPMVYWTHAQEPSGFMYVLLRTAITPEGLIPAIKREVQAMDGTLPVYDFERMDSLLGETAAQSEFNAFMIGLFAVIALVLAVVGLYGVMAYMVTQRTYEMGLRIALGAQRSGIIALIIRQGMGLAGLGIVIGLLMAFSATRFIASQLYGVNASDPIVFASVAIILGLITLLACYFPARRATGADPINALRQE